MARIKQAQSADQAAASVASILADLERAIRAAEDRADHHTHAVLCGLAVSAGALKHKAAEAVLVLAGDDGALAARLADLL